MARRKLINISNRSIVACMGTGAISPAASADWRGRMWLLGQNKPLEGAINPSDIHLWGFWSHPASRFSQKGVRTKTRTRRCWACRTPKSHTSSPHTCVHCLLPCVNHLAPCPRASCVRGIPPFTHAGPARLAPACSLAAPANAHTKSSYERENVYAAHCGPGLASALQLLLKPRHKAQAKRDASPLCRYAALCFVVVNLVVYL